jgi:glycosyltransferase involved in cell wall biosynthesis
LQANGDAMLQALDAHPHLFTLAGTVTDAHKLDLMRAADVFCSASEDETFGIAQLEAACLGLPVALSDLPCYAGIWKHGVNALLSPVGAVDVLAWNLKALMRDTGLADRLARAGYATAQRFTQERFLRGMSSVLVDAIEDRLPLFTAP